MNIHEYQAKALLRALGGCPLRVVLAHVRGAALLVLGRRLVNDPALLAVHPVVTAFRDRESESN